MKKKRLIKWVTDLQDEIECLQDDVLNLESNIDDQSYEVSTLQDQIEELMTQLKVKNK